MSEVFNVAGVGVLDGLEAIKGNVGATDAFHEVIYLREEKGSEWWRLSDGLYSFAEVGGGSEGLDVIGLLGSE